MAEQRRLDPLRRDGELIRFQMNSRRADLPSPRNKPLPPPVAAAVNHNELSRTAHHCSGGNCVLGMDNPKKREAEEEPVHSLLAGFPSLFVGVLTALASVGLAACSDFPPFSDLASPEGEAEAASFLAASL